jgi:hypothetical protein
MQVRQNTRALRATTHNALTSNTIAILGPMFVHPEVAEFLARVQSDYGSATPAEKLRFHMCLLSAFRHWDNLLYQFRNGMLEREMWESYDRTMASWLDNTAWRDWFVANAANFSVSLQTLLCRRISEVTH